VTIEDLAKSQGIWSSGVKDNSDIVLKSSIKIFRNIDGYAFSHKLGKKERESIQSFILKTIQNSNSLPAFSIYTLNEMSSEDRKIFYERNIIRESKPEKYIVLLSDDQNCYVILGGQEHIELVTLQSGFRVDEAYLTGKKIIADLRSLFKFVYQQKLGYLSADPNHLGSGIEILITLHLAGLTLSDRVNEISADLERKGFGLRGSWLDAYYEVYNKRSTGFLEENLYESALHQFELVVKTEKDARESICNDNKIVIEDKVWRSYGILLSSRLMSLYEALDHLSYVRLGISLGIINYISIKDINLLLYYIQDYHLRKNYNLYSLDGNLEEVRARFLRDYLKEVI
jgi:protein arginine kinase